MRFLTETGLIYDTDVRSVLQFLWRADKVESQGCRRPRFRQPGNKLNFRFVCMHLRPPPPEYNVEKQTTAHTKKQVVKSRSCSHGFNIVFWARGMQMHTNKAEVKFVAGWMEFRGRHTCTRSSHTAAKGRPIFNPIVLGFLGSLCLGLAPVVASTLKHEPRSLQGRLDGTLIICTKRKIGCVLHLHGCSYRLEFRTCNSAWLICMYHQSL